MSCCKPWINGRVEEEKVGGWVGGFYLGFLCEELFLFLHSNPDHFSFLHLFLEGGDFLAG